MEKKIDFHQIPEIIREILDKRGVKGKENIEKFLFPRLVDLQKPSLMQGLDKAVDIIIDYLSTGRRIIIWGDYDVDGTTGTALLVTFFKKLGRMVDWHIPNRLEEGYGLNAGWFHRQKKIAEEDDFLLITVDCGISDTHAIEQIQDLGGTVIITDHHSLPENSLPNCVILNPSQRECGFHHEYLAGVGVAFYLAAGLRARLSSINNGTEGIKDINLKSFLAFVALGTIADVVQLSQTNRILVRGGIEAMQNSPFKGITALLDSCDIHNEKIGSEDIGFLLGPLINAAGRIGDSETVVKLLTTETSAEAEPLAKKLVRLNSKRKSICIDGLENTLSKLSKRLITEEKAIVVKGDIHLGVAGIVASRLVDMFGVPSVIFSQKTGADGENILVGSARSVAGVNIVNCLNKTSELLLKYGGHEMAAGATLLEENFSEFRSRLKSIIGEAMTEKPAKIHPEICFQCSVEDVMSEECLAFFELLEPFGPENEIPVFTDTTARIVDCKRVGKGAEHLQVAIRGSYANYKGIGFGLGEQRQDIQRNPCRRLRFTPTKNRFRGKSSWQVRVISL